MKRRRKMKINVCRLAKSVKLGFKFNCSAFKLVGILIILGLFWSKATRGQQSSVTDYVSNEFTNSVRAFDDDELSKTMTGSIGEQLNHNQHQHSASRLAGETFGASIAPESRNGVPDVSIWSPIDQNLNEPNSIKTELGNHAEPSELEHQLASVLDNQSNITTNDKYEFAQSTQNNSNNRTVLSPAPSRHIDPADLVANSRNNQVSGLNSTHDNTNDGPPTRFSHGSAGQSDTGDKHHKRKRKRKRKPQPHSRNSAKKWPTNEGLQAKMVTYVSSLRSGAMAPTGGSIEGSISSSKAQNPLAPSDAISSSSPAASSFATTTLVIGSPHQVVPLHADGKLVNFVRRPPDVSFLAPDNDGHQIMALNHDQARLFRPIVQQTYSPAAASQPIIRSPSSVLLSSVGTDLAPQTSVLLGSAVKGPFHFDQLDPLVPPARTSPGTRASSQSHAEPMEAETSAETNSQVETSHELMHSTGPSPSISPADHMDIDDADLDQDLDDDGDGDAPPPQPPGGLSANLNQNSNPGETAARDTTTTKATGQQASYSGSNIISIVQQQRGNKSEGGSRMPASGEYNAQISIQQADSLASNTSQVMAPSGALAAKPVGHELLVGPFKSEAEAPATITLAGVVYQKSGASSALIKDAPAGRPRQPNDGQQHDKDVASSPGGFLGTPSSLTHDQPLPAGRPAIKVAQADKLWPYASLYHTTPAGELTQQQLNNNILIGSIKNGPDSLDQVALNSAIAPSASKAAPSAHHQATSFAHAIAGNDLSSPGAIRFSPFPLSSVLSSLTLGNSQRFVSLTQPPDELLSNSGASKQIIVAPKLIGQTQSSNGNVVVSASSSALSDSLLDSQDTLSSSSSNSGDSRGVATIFARPGGGGGQSAELVNNMGASASVDTHQFSESKHKEKPGPIVIVQKDVKPVKYHLLRAYLKLRRLLRPFEATYVFPNDSSGFLRRLWYKRRQQP